MNRDFSLKERVENTRDQQQIRCVVHFNLQEIKDRFDDSIRSIENKFDLYDELNASGKMDEAKDVLRSQIVFLEGVLDFYLHEMTKYSYFKMFLNEWDKTSQYKNFNVKMEVVEVGLNSSNSKDWFFEYVNDSFNRVVFMSSESMKDQLNSIGIPYKDVMHNVFNKRSENESMKEGNRFVQSLFKRRNAIAHQNDRSHDSGIQDVIEKLYVVDNIETVKKIAYEIFSIANAK